MTTDTTTRRAEIKGQIKHYQRTIKECEQCLSALRAELTALDAAEITAIHREQDYHAD